MTDIRSSEGMVLTVYGIPAYQLRSQQADINTVIRQTASSVRVTEAQQFSVFRQNSETRVYQQDLMVVCRGRAADPKLRAWTYSMDGHDYYVLRLGDTKTLVFDLSTGQWSSFATGAETVWNVTCGFNWRSAGAVAASRGSNVVVGDDSHGILWVLDPEKGADEHPFGGDDIKFTRIATGQMPATSRQYIPVYSVNLSGSFGYPSVITNSVKLEYSDDQGRTYYTADQPQVSETGQYNQEFFWRSMGQVSQPGRLFRLTDDGAFSRIDELLVNE